MLRAFEKIMAENLDMKRPERKPRRPPLIEGGVMRG